MTGSVMDFKMEASSLLKKLDVRFSLPFYLTLNIKIKRQKFKKF